MNPEQKPIVEQIFTDSKFIRLDRVRQAIPVVLGLATLACVGVLFGWDTFPLLFPYRAHEVLAALPLALIALAYLVHQAAHRPQPRELGKAILLAVAFLLWAANQFWPNIPQSTLFNDIAVALFVLDVFLVMIGWPQASPDESFANAYVNPLGISDRQEHAAISSISVTASQLTLIPKQSRLIIRRNESKNLYMAVFANADACLST